jgi:phage shock protein E
MRIAGARPVVFVGRHSAPTAPPRTHSMMRRTAPLREGGFCLIILPVMKSISLLLALVLLPIISLFAEPAPAAPKNVTINDAEKLIKEDPKVVVLDVRTPAEFKAGHIAGAKNIDFNGNDFDKQVAALDKSKTYIVHCAAGGRSAQACKIIEQVKLPSVFHMSEGFKAWEKAGKPVEK